MTAPNQTTEFVEVQGARVPVLGFGTWQIEGRRCHGGRPQPARDRLAPDRHRARVRQGLPRSAAAHVADPEGELALAPARELRGLPLPVVRRRTRADRRAPEGRPPDRPGVRARLGRLSTDNGAAPPAPRPSQAQARAVTRMGAAPGAVAEWLRSGLQSRLHRFDSGRRLPAKPRTPEPAKQGPTRGHRVRAPVSPLGNPAVGVLPADG